MKIVCLFMLAILFLAIPLTVWSQKAPDGADIFNTRCGSCHGEKGEGLASVKIPPVKGTAMTVEQLVTFITKGGGKTVHTTPIVNITPDEATAVAKHVKSLK
jgi:mono/diheme cytochrome c family protein